MSRFAFRVCLANLTGLVILGIATSALATPPPLPGGPGGPAGPAGPAGPGAAADAGAAQATPGAVESDGVRRGIVQVESGGRPMAVGTVLAKDGRVLTSLSGLTNLEQVDLRFADGTVARARVAHKDKQWDLALLVPLTGKWQDGLVPSNADPAGLALRTYLPQKGKLGPAAVSLKGRADAHARDGETLKDVIELDLKGGTAVLGAPLLEPEGNVLGVLVRGCAGPGKAATKDAAKEEGKPVAKDAPPPCTPATFVAPVYALRRFLMKTPADAVQPAPWLGLGGAPSDAGNVRGVKVVGLAPGSPAEKAGLKAGGEAPDTIVALDGQPVESPEQLAAMIAKRGVGQTIKLLVFSAGKFREAPVTLRAAP